MFVLYKKNLFYTTKKYRVKTVSFQGGNMIFYNMTWPPIRAVFGSGPNEEFGLTYMLPVTVKSPQNCNNPILRRNMLPCIFVPHGRVYLCMFCKYRLPFTWLLYCNNAPAPRLSTIMSPSIFLF